MQPPSDLSPAASSSATKQPTYVTSEQFTAMSDKWAEQLARMEALLSRGNVFSTPVTAVKPMDTQAIISPKPFIPPATSKSSTHKSDAKVERKRDWFPSPVRKHSSKGSSQVSKTVPSSGPESAKQSTATKDTSSLLASTPGTPRWQSGNTLASHLCGRGSIPVMAISGKAGSCLPLVGSLQYRTLANYMVSSALPTTRRDMTCTVLKAT